MSTPGTFTWTGTGGDGLWGNPSNWHSDDNPGAYPGASPANIINITQNATIAITELALPECNVLTIGDGITPVTVTLNGPNKITFINSGSQLSVKGGCVLKLNLLVHIPDSGTMLMHIGSDAVVEMTSSFRGDGSCLPTIQGVSSSRFAQVSGTNIYSRVIIIRNLLCEVGSDEDGATLAKINATIQAYDFSTIHIRDHGHVTEIIVREGCTLRGTGSIGNINNQNSTSTAVDFLDNSMHIPGKVADSNHPTILSGTQTIYGRVTYVSGSTLLLNINNVTDGIPGQYNTGIVTNDIYLNGLTSIISVNVASTTGIGSSAYWNSVHDLELISTKSFRITTDIMQTRLQIDGVERSIMVTKEYGNLYSIGAINQGSFQFIDKSTGKFVTWMPNKLISMPFAGTVNGIGRFMYNADTASTLPSISSDGIVTPDSTIAALTEEEMGAMLSGAQLSTDGVSINEMTEPETFKSSLIHATNLPLNLTVSINGMSGSGTEIDADGLYHIKSNGSTYKLNFFMLGAKGGDRNMLCIYRLMYNYLRAPTNVYDFNNTNIKFCIVAPHTNVMERGFCVTIPYEGATGEQQIGNLGSAYLTNPTHTSQYDSGDRYGFILINRGWDLLPQFTGNITDIPWESIRNHCRFSQPSLNFYDGFPASSDITDQSHFTARPVTISGRAFDVFSVEDLPHKSTGTPGWDRSDKDFNDVVFALEVVPEVV
jgi:hypothetical protein